SGDPFYTAALAQAGVDLTLRLVDKGGVETLTLSDSAAGEVSSRAVSSVAGRLDIIGSAYNDTLKVELDPAVLQALLPEGIAFDAREGADTLQGPAQASTWNITGTDTGTLGETIHFTGVENLTGASGNEDTFVFAAGGSLSGKVDGGAAGFDTLVITGND